MRAFRQWTKDDEAKRAFYQQSIRPGNLVFDVGANMGNRSKIFLRLGARVIAFEPQPKCARFLRAAFRHHDFVLEQKALGPESGKREMWMCNADTLSSLSPGWIQAVRDSGRFSMYEWDRREIVTVDTLDNAVAKHGRPDFVKIDVEGYEFEALSGVSRPLKLVSFEFTPEFLENTRRCLDRLCSMGETEFQLSLRETNKFELDAWVSVETLKDALSRIRDPKTFGDVYARCVA